MKRNEDATCATCPYWKRMEEGDVFGLCRIGPPTREPDRISDPTGKWVTVFHTAWCGQHPYFVAPPGHLSESELRRLNEIEEDFKQRPENDRAEA